MYFIYYDIEIEFLSITISPPTAPNNIVRMQKGAYLLICKLSHTFTKTNLIFTHFKMFVQIYKIYLIYFLYMGCDAASHVYFTICIVGVVLVADWCLVVYCALNKYLLYIHLMCSIHIFDLICKYFTFLSINL